MVARAKLESETLVGAAHALGALALVPTAIVLHGLAAFRAQRATMAAI